MNQSQEVYAREAKIACDAGDYSTALMIRMEGLRRRALDFLDADGVTINWTKDPSTLSLAEVYAEESHALSMEIDRQGQAAKFELLTARNIYGALSEVLRELANPSPADGQRISKLLFHGMDMANMDYLCGFLEKSPAQYEIARQQLKAKGGTRRGAAEGNKKQREWYDDAFIAHAVYLRGNRDQKKRAVSEAIAFISGRGVPGKREDSLTKAIQRNADDYEFIVQAVESVAGGSRVGVPEKLLEPIRAALSKFGPGQR